MDNKWSEESDEELSSDEELQVDLLKGYLAPGLVQRALPPKTYTNNVAGLRAGLVILKKNELEWLERLDIVATASAPLSEEDNDVNPEDDFKREMHFYQQALSSVVVGQRKLEELGVPIKRPDDYFAEMLKNDDHMRKVRQNLLTRQKIIEKKEKLRKLREQKKFGKKVQQGILQKRRDDKKASLDAIKRFRKGKGEKPSFLTANDGDDDFPVAAHQEARGVKGQKHVKSKKRQMRDKTYGFGGKKRHLKSNTADSSADMSSFSSARHSRKTGGGRMGGAKGRPGTRGGPASGQGKKKQPRLGKSRRQKIKLKR